MSTTTGERFTIGEIQVGFLLEGEASGGSVAVFEFTVPAGARVPISHSHDAYEGTVDGRVVDVGQGDVLCIPRGAVHRFDNEHAADVRMLAIVTPGVLRSDYFRELAAVLEAAAAAGGPPEPSALVEVMRRHGLTPAP